MTASCSHAKCTHCQEWKGKIDEGWKGYQIDDSRRKGSALLCLSCKREGHTEKDSNLYLCKGCKQSQARGKFDGKSLNHWKTAQKNTRDYILLCLVCAEKEQRILAKLSCNDARLCKCKQPLGHSDRCPVHPGSHSGWNKGVTLQDLRSLQYREKFVKKFNIS